MKKQLIVSALFLFVLTVNAQQISMEILRKEYYNLHTDSIATVKLYGKLSKITPADNLTKAYKGATTTAMAQYAKGKGEKIKLFNSGKKMLEESVSADTANTELRFLRYTVQTNAPKALGYHNQIDNDKRYLLNNYEKTDHALVKNRIKEYLLTSGKLNEAEKKKIKPNEK